MEINQPNHSHAEVAIFFVVERCQSSKRISGSILREIETIHDTLIFVSMAESSGYGHLRRPPKLKNFCTWVAFIRNMDSHASQKWSSSTDHKPNEALPPCGPCDLCWVQDVRKGEVNVQRFVSLVTWPHLSSCQGSTRYLCTCHNHCQCAFPWCNTKGLNQDKFKSAKPISFCTSLLTTSCSIVPRLAISPYRTITPYPVVPCLAMRYIPISWNVYSVLSYHIRLYHVFSYYPCTPVKTGAHPPVAICLWQGSFLWAVSNPNTLEQSWGTDFWEIKKVWGWTHKRYYIETIPHFKDVQSWEPFQVSGVSWLLLENMGKGQTHQLKMCATGSSLFSQSQFHGCMPADICFSRKHVLGGPLFSDPLERPAWGLQTMRGGQLAGGSGDPCKSSRPVDT